MKVRLIFENGLFLIVSFNSVAEGMDFTDNLPSNVHWHAEQSDWANPSKQWDKS